MKHEFSHFSDPIKSLCVTLRDDVEREKRKKVERDAVAKLFSFSRFSFDALAEEEKKKEVCRSTISPYSHTHTLT